MAIPEVSASGQNPAYRSSLDFLPPPLAKGPLSVGRTLPFMGYFRERAKPALIGFVIGLIVGWFQPAILGVKPPDPSARLFLTMQMGLAFTMIGLFVANYLHVRRRVHAKYGKNKQT